MDPAPLPRRPYFQNLSFTETLFNFRSVLYSMSTTKKLPPRLKDPVPTGNERCLWTPAQWLACYLYRTNWSEVKRQSFWARSACLPWVYTGRSSLPPPFAVHIKASGCTSDKNTGVRLLHVEDAFRKRIAQENLEIKKAIFDNNFITVHYEIPQFILTDAVYDIAHDNIIMIISILTNFSFM